MASWLRERCRLYSMKPFEIMGMPPSIDWLERKKELARNGGIAG